MSAPTTGGADGSGALDELYIPSLPCCTTSTTAADTQTIPRKNSVTSVSGRTRGLVLVEPPFTTSTAVEGFAVSEGLGGRRRMFANTHAHAHAHAHATSTASRDETNSACSSTPSSPTKVRRLFQKSNSFDINKPTGRSSTDNHHLHHPGKSGPGVNGRNKSEVGG